MSLYRRLPGAVLAAAGLACGVEATTFDVAFLTDPVGPKALPLLAAAILMAVGVRETIRPNAAVVWPSRRAIARAGGATVAFLAYSVALPWLGFFLSTALVVTALSTLFGAQLRRTLPAAAGLAGALWLLFVVGLGLPLPVGSLWIL
jgi:putative tricarboxylic transport membrane protein